MLTDAGECKSLLDSLNLMCKPQVIPDYDTEVHGKQTVTRTVRFKECAPVLLININRLDFDMEVSLSRSRPRPGFLDLAVARFLFLSLSPPPLSLTLARSLSISLSLSRFLLLYRLDGMLRYADI